MLTQFGHFIRAHSLSILLIISRVQADFSRKLKLKPLANLEVIE